MIWAGSGGAAWAASADFGTVRKRLNLPTGGPITIYRVHGGGPEDGDAGLDE